MIQHTGGHMPVAMEEYSKNAVKSPEGGFFAAMKKGEILCMQS